MKPLGPRAASALGALAFLAVIAGVLVTGSWRGDFRVDEAFKISETPFLRLWIRGDFGHPAWFANIIDRTNPPAGKYLFGVAILSTGQPLPPLPTMAVRDPSVPPLHAPALSAAYRPMLHAVRFVSALSIALIAALLTTLLARHHGWISAAAAFALFALNDITRTFAATGVFDPLFALFFVVSIALMTALAADPPMKRVIIAAVAIGAVTALAFQTRVNGLFAFLIAMPFLWVMLHRAIRKAVVATTVATGAFVATTMLLNPYYWSTPDVPIEPFSSHHGLLRPIQRLVQQQRDILSIAAPWQDARMEARTVAEKGRFLVEMMLSNLPGVLLGFAALTGVILLAMRWRSIAHPLRAVLLMSLAAVIAMVMSLPMPWLRYLLVDVAPLALLGGFGAGEITRVAVLSFRFTK